MTADLFTSFTPAQLAAAVSPETAVVIHDYPYGFRLRCQMRVWIEFKPGKGFRYCTQTTNPKKPGTVWNKPKAGTYWRVSCAIAQNCEGHLQPVGLNEFSSLAEYAAFLGAFAPNLSPAALGSATYFRDCKLAFEAKRESLGLVNVFDGTPEQMRECKAAALAEMSRHIKAGTSY